MYKTDFKWRNMIAIVICSLVMMAFYACDDENNDPDDPELPPTETVEVTKITINPPASVDITAGGTITLTVTVEPPNATDKTVTWSSSDNTIATVSATGVVTALKAGTVVITATTKNGKVAAQFTLTIKPAASSGPVELTNAMINTGNVTLNSGTYQVKTNLTLNSGNNLTISPGVTILFDKDRSLTAQTNAKIFAKGTSSQRITFSSSLETRSPGDWRGLYLSQNGSEFDWCVFEYGSGQSSGYGMIYLDNCKASITNCTFRYSKYSGIYFYQTGSGFTTFNNNNMSDCGEKEVESYPIKVGSYALFSGLGDMGNNVITTEKGIGVSGGTISQNITIKSYVPYLFYGSATFNTSAVLTIEPGSTLKFETGRSITVNGGAKVIAEGTDSNPITFTSAKIGNKMPGDWYGIYLSSDNSVFKHCIFEYGSGSSSGWGMLYLDNCKVSVTNCTFRYSKYSGIYLYAASSGFTTFNNNKISDCGEKENDSYPIKVGSYALFSGLGDMGNNVITTEKGIGVSGGTISQNITIKSYVPYLFYGSATFNTSAVLTIEPGSTLKFEAGRSITVNGGAKIIAESTASNPITFTSAKIGNKMPGDWYGIYISSNNSVFKHCIFEYGSGSSSGWGMVYLDNSKASFMNCTFRYSKYSGIYLYNTSSGFTDFDNNTMSECGENELESYPIKSGSYAGIMNLSVFGANNTITSKKGIGVSGSTVTGDITLKKYLYEVYGGNLTISQAASGGATLTILPGVKLMFTQARTLYVGTGGKLVAEGTSSNKITITGSTADRGWWHGIIFNSNNALSGSVLNYCEISYGGRGTSAGNNGNISCESIRSGVLTVKNCTITHSRAWGIYVYPSGSYQAYPSIENNNTYSNNGQNNNSNVGGTVIGTY